MLIKILLFGCAVSDYGEKARQFAIAKHINGHVPIRKRRRPSIKGKILISFIIQKLNKKASRILTYTSEVSCRKYNYKESTSS